ncbi:hypothetical protein [Corynebacterium felinum]|nr:hypothetical protein [Corynebacterium felinum]
MSNAANDVLILQAIGTNRSTVMRSISSAFIDISISQNLDVRYRM